MDWVQLALDETFKAIEEEQERMAGLKDQHTTSTQSSVLMLIF